MLETRLLGFLSDQSPSSAAESRSARHEPPKERHKEHVNHERWLVSYADFITLLFAFFVVLYATTQVDNKKVSQVSAAIQGGFQQMGAFSGTGSGTGSAGRVEPSPSRQAGQRSLQAGSSAWRAPAAAVPGEKRSGEIAGRRNSQTSGGDAGSARRPGGQPARGRILQHAAKPNCCRRPSRYSLTSRMY